MCFYQLCTPAFGSLSHTSLQILHSSVRLELRHLWVLVFSILILQWSSRPSFGWTTQEHSETCPKAAPVLSWLCALGHSRPQRWILTLVQVLCVLLQLFFEGPLYICFCVFPQSQFPVPTTHIYQCNTVLKLQHFITGITAASWWAVVVFTSHSMW